MESFIVIFFLFGFGDKLIRCELKKSLQRCVCLYLLMVNTGFASLTMCRTGKALFLTHLLVSHCNESWPCLFCHIVMHIVMLFIYFCFVIRCYSADHTNTVIIDSIL